MRIPYSSQTHFQATTLVLFGFWKIRFLRPTWGRKHSLQFYFYNSNSQLKTNHQFLFLQKIIFQNIYELEYLKASNSILTIDQKGILIANLNGLNASNLLAINYMIAVNRCYLIISKAIYLQVRIIKSYFLKRAWIDRSALKKLEQVIGIM
ncbi:unnamed protein product [Paramecium octaurelia]|uniref:Uncharacterized protein n=1 Tax=Paramecium octaurelia TaxID=43137 RepID=A0A8S1X8R0_PAROT|nr:unnamed protein product [Paramecium octaurelia]